MKATVLLPVVMMVFLVSSVLADPPAIELVEFDKMSYDMGLIQQGDPQTVNFTLTNHSGQPMILTNVKGSCGCTATAYTREPIMPGESTSIEATYNAKSLGVFAKTVKIFTNLQEEAYVLHIKGEVIASKVIDRQ